MPSLAHVLQAFALLGLVFLPNISSLQDVEGNDNVSIPGHNQPLGYHQPSSGNIDLADGFLEPTIFFERYAGKSKAVLFKGAWKNLKATKEWSDKTLRCVSECQVSFLLHL